MRICHNFVIAWADQQLIVFLLIGFAAGVLNVMRAAGRIAEPGQRYKRESSDDGGSN